MSARQRTKKSRKKVCGELAALPPVAFAPLGAADGPRKPGRKPVAIVPKADTAQALQKRLPGAMGKLAQAAIIGKSPALTIFFGPTEDTCSLFVSGGMSDAANDPVLLERLLAHGKRARAAMVLADDAGEPPALPVYSDELFAGAELKSLVQQQQAGDAPKVYGTYVAFDTEHTYAALQTQPQHQAARLINLKTSFSDAVESEFFAELADLLIAPKTAPGAAGGGAADIVLRSADSQPTDAARAVSPPPPPMMLAPAPLLPRIAIAADGRSCTLCHQDAPLAVDCDTIHARCTLYAVWH